MTMLELLGIGIPWDTIDELSPRDTTYILAFHTARKEREQELRASEEAKTYSGYDA